jgi:hypothetical protein
VAHKPLKIKDHKGKEVAPHIVLEVVDAKGQKRKVKAGEYYQLLNDLEKRLNKLGYSTADLQSNKLPTAAFQARSRYGQQTILANQQKEIAKAHSAKQISVTTHYGEKARQARHDPKRPQCKLEGKKVTCVVSPAKPAAPAVAQKPPAQPAKPAVAQKPAQPPTPSTAAKPAKAVSAGWSKEIGFGTEKVLKVFVGARYSLDGNAGLSSESKPTGNGFKFDASAEAGAYLFGKRYNLARLSALAHAATDGPAKARLALAINDKEIWSVGTDAIKWAYNCPFSPAPKGLGAVGFAMGMIADGGNTVPNRMGHFEGQVTFVIYLGPIPVKVTVGARGAVGLACSLEIGLAYLSGMVTPQAKVTVFADVNVDLWLAGAGVRGTVNLIDWSMPIGATAYLSIPELAIRYSATINNRFKALAGKIELYAWINYIFGKKEWTHTLFSWGGYDLGGKELYRKNEILKL